MEPHGHVRIWEGIEIMKWIARLANIVVCLWLVGQPALCSAGQHGVLIISPANSALSYVTDDSQRQLATVKGILDYGMDGNDIVILQNPRNDHQPGARLLVIDRDTFHIVIDTNVNDIHIGSTMVPTMKGLVVKSQDSTFYYSGFDGKELNVFEFNWLTQSNRKLNFLTDVETRGLNPALTPVSYGFAVTCNRLNDSSLVVLYNTISNSVVLKLANPVKASFDLYGIPDFGLIEYSHQTLYRLTDKSFTIALVQPSVITNLEIATDICSQTRGGEPYLIWGSNMNALASNKESISEVVFFDPKRNITLQQQPLGINAWKRFAPARDGYGIYFVEPQKGTVYYFDASLGTVTGFADTGSHDFALWNGAAILDGN